MSTGQLHDVELDAAGVELAGHLRVPADAATPGPALVFTGPFTGVKEQVVGTYAQQLAAAGYVTLAFDHRNFGASGGKIRQHEDSAGKLADLSAATSFLASHPAVDSTRIGCVGICLGGGYALKHSAFDPRIKALALVAAAFNSPLAMQHNMGAQAYRAMMANFSDVAQRQYADGVVDYMPTVSADGGEAAMGGREPWDYYGTERSASPGWTNQVTRLSLRELLTFDAAIGAAFLDTTPTLIVHGRTDDYCSPDAAQEVFDRIEGAKDIMWLDTTNHIDLYDQPQYVDPAVARVSAWMNQHL